MAPESESKRGGTVRPYTAADHDGCLALLRSNVPEHFLAQDEEELSAFLNRLPGPYFVVEDEQGVIAACGGIAAERDDPRVATLCWGIVHRDRQRQGLGRALTLHRLREAPPGTERVRLNTTQKVQSFYARLGFVVTEVIENGYGPGLDHVRMEQPFGGRMPRAP